MEHSSKFSKQRKRLQFNTQPQQHDGSNNGRRNNLELLVPSLPARSLRVTCLLVLKVTHGHTDTLTHWQDCLWLWGLYAEHKTPKTQQSQAAETLECICEHAHSKVLIVPTWRNQRGRHFGFVFEEDSGRQITWLSWCHRISKSFIFKTFSVHTKTQSSFFKFLCFQERFPKASFSVANFSGLVWTEGLTGEIKLRFQIPLA